MRAVFKLDDRPEFIAREVEMPKIEPDEVLVKVRVAGLCGTDVAIRNNTFMGRHGRVKPPVIPGHEFCGEVVELGAAARKLKVGDRVVTSAIKGCNKCYACRTGALNRCHQWIHVGIDSPGCFAEYASIYEDILFPVPDDIPDEEAAVLEPLTTAVRAVRTNDIKVGSFVVVMGPGPFGIFILQAVLATGPSHVVMIGLSSDEERLKLAQKLGADEIIYADLIDPVQRIEEMTKGKMADLVIEATGNAEAVNQAIEMTGAGALCLIGGSGFQGRSVSFKPWNLVRDEKRLKGLQGFTWADYLLTLQLYSQEKIKIKPVISHMMKLSEINEACTLVEQKKAMKITITP